MNDKTLSIRERNIINVKLSRNNLRLYNVLFISYLNANLFFTSCIVLKDFYVIHDYKLYIVYKTLNNKNMFQTKRINSERL